jgi:hypothetical protein
MPFISHIHTLYDDMCKIGMESPDVEFWVVGKTFGTPYIFILSDNMSAIHHISQTKTKTHSFGALVIENLSVASSRDVESQPWTRSNRDLLSDISTSRGGATKRSPLSYREPFTILLYPTRGSKDRSESSKTSIFHVMTIHTLVDPWQY